MAARSLVVLLSGGCLTSPPQGGGDAGREADASPGAGADAMCSAFFSDPFSDNELHEGRWEHYEEGGGTVVPTGTTVELRIDAAATYAFAAMWSRDRFPALHMIAGQDETRLESSLDDKV